MRLKRQQLMSRLKEWPQLRPREGLSDRFLRLSRVYFRVLATVLLSVVLSLFLVIPHQCYQLGNAVANGSSYVTSGVPSPGLWKSLLAFPVRAEPALVEPLNASSSGASQSKNQRPAFLSGRVCAIYLGSSQGLNIFYVHSGFKGKESRTFRVPAGATQLRRGHPRRANVRVRPNPMNFATTLNVPFRSGLEAAEI